MERYEELAAKGIVRDDYVGPIPEDDDDYYGSKYPLPKAVSCKTSLLKDRSDSDVQPLMKSDLETFGSHDPLKGLLRYGGTVWEDDPYGPPMTEQERKASEQATAALAKQGKAPTPAPMRAPNEDNIVHSLSRVQIG